MRYGAMLMFEYRRPGVKKSCCEDRIILINAKSAKDAAKQARKYGKKSQLLYEGMYGDMIHIEFLGIKDLLALEYVAEEEVFYEMYDAMEPRARKERWIPKEKDLNAFWVERNRRTPARGAILRFRPKH